ncbi:hypothetical protein E1293_20585 [Actinomadura darangshiensis]|uniref:Uncharacterized protein n=1 Tax=Actinomadura darangshiensis TaxID=705336 RepID=A0A4R5BAP7_9ACTN|nr:hypothetical protein [Actinomadura darangshiensis]TDD80512.1 hypothetical protein E1293_20585 [Actinomadura darangshiensis]
MSAFNSYDTLMGTADTEVGIAQFILPPAVMIAVQFKLSKGNPVNLEKAGQEWDKAAQAIEETRNLLQQGSSAISAKDWTAEDRPAYEQKVQEFCQQLDILHTYCQAVSIALIGFAWALFIYAVFAIAMGTFLAALAAVAAAALAGIITAEITAACEAIAATCLTVTIVATGILAAAAQMAAIVFQGGSFLAAVAESFKGNDQALDDFMTAEATGSAAALANLGQNAINGGLAFAGRGPSGKGLPISNVDLDADRNAEHTWNVGGGATYTAPGGTEITGGGHVKYGDHGFAGGDVSGGVKTAGGASVDGNVEYTDEDGIGQGNSGSIKYGANAGIETPGSSSTTPGGPEVPNANAGAKVGVEGEHDFETGQGKVSGSGSVQVNGGDVIKDSGTVNYDGKGNTSTSGSVDTPFGTGKAGDETPPWDK